MGEVLNFVPENPFTFICESCQYKTRNKKDYKKHCLTAKHIKTQITQKNAKYSCEHCQFFSDNKTDYNRHLSTAKHLKNMPELVVPPLQQEQKNYHDDDDDDAMKEMFSNIFEKMMTEQTQFIQEKFQELAEKQESTNEKLIEIASHPTTTTINNNNNNFNLNFFLNETCKDALVIDDFFDSLEITDDEFYRFGEIGFKRALAEFLTNNIKQLSYIERPIHCSDAKRKIHHIKTENGWTHDKEKYKFPITKGIKNFQWRELSKIQKHNPTYDDSDSICIKKQNALCQWWTGGSEDISFVDKIFDAFEKMANEMIIPKQVIKHT